MILSALFLATVGQDAMIRYPFLSPVFSDHMVLQRGRPNTFWGWTKPGEKVSVTIQKNTGHAVAGPDGKWVVKVDPPAVGGPYSVVITGPEKRTLTDVLVGDVWLCGGQSNMQFSVAGALNGKEEIAAANHPQIRFAVVPTRMSFEPTEFTTASWKVCSPSSLGNDEWNGLSAVGYFFGRELQKDLNIPIGLVHDNRGGSSAESWLSYETLVKQGEFGGDVAKIDEARRTGHEAFGKQSLGWIQQVDPLSTTDSAAAADFDDHDWQKASLPGSWHDLGLDGHLGVVWFRTTVDLPESAIKGDAKLSLGAIAQMDWTWVNGVKVGATYEYRKGRAYSIPAGVLKPGRNVIAVRVLTYGFQDGFLSPADKLSLTLSDGSKVSLANDAWKLHRGPHLWAGPEFPWEYDAGYHTPTIHYNGMIAPIAPLAIKGVIWYQGESNVGRSKQYIDLMQRVAAEWRNAFQVKELPFLQVQLANYLKRTDQPVESGWAALRDAQMKSASLIPGGGVATATDVGDADDIHPRNKQAVGLRLAKVALHQVYGRSIVATGPRYRAFKKSGSDLRIAFDSVGSGLTVHGGELKGFAIAGSDHKFHWATAKIVGKEVVLSSPEVTDPVAARYAWADNPEMTLYNQEGLPAFPFRTDDWPVY